MIFVKRTGRFKVKISHPDYEMIKVLQSKQKRYIIMQTM